MAFTPLSRRGVWCLAAAFILSYALAQAQIVLPHTDRNVADEGSSLTGWSGIEHGLLEKNHLQPGKHHRPHRHHDRPDQSSPDEHSPFEWTPHTVAAVVLASVCALLANAAGIGGGPFYVPLFNVVLGFNLKLCTGLSHSVVAVGAIGSTLYGLIQRSPVNRDATLLNFDIALVLIPAMLFGVSFGVLFNPLTPNWLQTLLLSALLIVVVRKTYAKGFKQLKAEKAKPSASEEDQESGATESLLEGDASAPPARRQWGRAVSIVLDRGSSGVDEHYSSAHVEDKQHPSAAELAERTEAVLLGIVRRIPWLKAIALVALWAVFLALQMEKAKHGNCTLAFALVVGGQVVLLAAVAIAFVWYQSYKASHDPESVDSELHKLMTHSPTGGGDTSEPATKGVRNLVIVASVVAFAGFIAGLLGIGGALIFNPILLSLDVNPQVVASTAVLVILFGSSSISLSFLFNGMLNTSYIAVFAPVAFVSSLVGVTVIGYLVRKSGRSSIIILLMATVIAAGTAATIGFGGVRSYHDIRSGHNVGFKSFCDS